jgi:hypothetical protein
MLAGEIGIKGMSEIVDLTPYWDGIVETAQSRKSQKNSYLSTKQWARDESTHLIGLCGEATFAVVTGLLIDGDLLINGDPGYDFEYFDNGVRVTFDIKSSPYPKPHLLEFVNKELKADYYVLVTIDLKNKQGKILGWVSKEQFLKAEVRDFGRGPRLSFNLSELMEMGQTGVPNFLIKG